MERLERLARTLLRAAEGLVALPTDTMWCLAVLVAAWFHLASIGVGPHPEGVVRVSHMVPFLVLAVLLAALVIWAHRGNIARLRAGTERRLGQSASPAAGSGSATSS